MPDTPPPAATPPESNSQDANAQDTSPQEGPTPGGAALEGAPRKGPLSFLSGALTSGLLCWLCLGLSKGLATYFALHPPSYSSAIAQSIAAALKTLLVGMAFLATFTFGFIALGLSLVLLRSLLRSARPGDTAS